MSPHLDRPIVTSVIKGKIASATGANVGQESTKNYVLEFILEGGELSNIAVMLSCSQVKYCPKL